MDISLIVILSIVVAAFLAALNVGGGSYSEPDEIKVHPKLEGKELDQWLKLYEGISIQYARSLVTEHGIAEMTWEAYEKLTGKEVWETVPNPDKVADETR